MADYSSYTFTIGQIPSGAGGYLTMLNALVTELQTDVTALETTVIVQGGTLTANLNAGGFKLTNLGASSDANDACTVSYANSLLTLGGDPGSVAITDLDDGTATANQLIGINAAGTAVVGISHSQRVAVLDSASSGLTPIGTPDIFKISDDFYVSNQNLLSVANDVFFCGHATGSSTVYSSTDGGTWTARTMPSSQDWGPVTWSGINYVCVNGVGTSAAYSTDYISWTASTLATSASGCYSLATDGAGKVLTSSTGTIQLSTDHGVTWANVAGVVGEFVGYIGGLFIAVDVNSVNYKTSPDGSTWTARTAPGSKTFMGSATYFCVHGGNWVAVMTDGTAYKTTDGINWTSLGALPFNSVSARVIVVNGVYFAYTTLPTGRYMYSHDFVTWHPVAESIPTATVSTPFEANSDDSVFVALNVNGSTYYPTYCSKTDTWLFEV